MNVFGLTGGIGMGKSAAAQLLRDCAVPVIDTDALAREIVEPGQPALAEIQTAFGQEVIGPTGELRRDQLARIVFCDPVARQKLEDITHPRIRQLWVAQLDSWRKQEPPVAVVVIPLLFETVAEAEMDKVVCVACSTATQRQRLRDRGWTAEQIESRNAAQWPVEKKMNLADYVLWNEGSLDVLGEQIQRVIPLR